LGSSPAIIAIRNVPSARHYLASAASCAFEKSKLKKKRLMCPRNIR
jgi:hypothetical protein